MSRLSVYDEATGRLQWVSEKGNEMSATLHEVGVRFERWAADMELSDAMDESAILKAYKTSVDLLMAEKGYQAVDVMHVRADNPNKETLRNKFLDEHIHTEDEVRFFVEGQGLFCLHIRDKIYAVLCEKGDLISVPDRVKHWFDMGAEPHLTCIRLFTNPEGWVAHYTSDPIAHRFPKKDS